jgi:hypothetical protein
MTHEAVRTSANEFVIGVETCLNPPLLPEMFNCLARHYGAD